MLSRFRFVLLALTLFLATSIFLNRGRIEERLKPPEPDEEQSQPPDESDKGRYHEQASYQDTAPRSDGCVGRPEWLRELAGSPDIKFPVRYARRDIVVRENSDLDLASVTKVDGPLLPAFQELKSADEPELKKGGCLPPLELEVPSITRPINASHIIFGAATTIERLAPTVPYFQRWLANSNARLIVDVQGNDNTAPDKKAMKELELRMRGLGMQVTLLPAMEKNGNNIERYFSLVKTLYRLKDDDTKWFAFIDDDTFFTSMSGLIKRLSEYDWQKEWYLGAVSEEWWTVCQYGWIAMGGGGIFLSKPLVALMEKNYAYCKEKAWRNFGDHRIAECIDHITDTQLTQFDGLYQIDLHGDRSGVFESGRQILSQHHWKEGYWSEDGAGDDAIRHPRWFPLDAMSLVSDVCGDSCLFQRWQIGKDTILSNGYSISVYPKGHLKDLQLFKMEKTWGTPINVEGSLNPGYDHYTGPMRPALELDKEKLQYRFMDAKLVEGGGVRQYFRHLGKDGELDTLIELRWTKE